MLIGHSGSLLSSSRSFSTVCAFKRSALSTNAFTRSAAMVRRVWRIFPRAFVVSTRRRTTKYPHVRFDPTLIVQQGRVHTRCRTMGVHELSGGTEADKVGARGDMGTGGDKEGAHAAHATWYYQMIILPIAMKRAAARHRRSRPRARRRRKKTAPPLPPNPVAFVAAWPPLANHHRAPPPTTTDWWWYGGVAICLLIVVWWWLRRRRGYQKISRVTQHGKHDCVRRPNRA